MVLEVQKLPINPGTELPINPVNSTVTTLQIYGISMRDTILYYVIHSKLLMWGSLLLYLKIDVEEVLFCASILYP